MASLGGNCLSAISQGCGGRAHRVDTKGSADRPRGAGTPPAGGVGAVELHWLHPRGARSGPCVSQCHGCALRATLGNTTSTFLCCVPTVPFKVPQSELANPPCRQVSGPGRPRCCAGRPGGPARVAVGPRLAARRPAGPGFLPQPLPLRSWQGTLGGGTDTARKVPESSRRLFCHGPAGARHRPCSHVGDTWSLGGGPWGTTGCPGLGLAGGFAAFPRSLARRRGRDEVIPCAYLPLGGFPAAVGVRL